MLPGGTLYLQKEIKSTEMIYSLSLTHTLGKRNPNKPKTQQNFPTDSHGDFSNCRHLSDVMLPVEGTVVCLVGFLYISKIVLYVGTDHFGSLTTRVFL